LNLETHYLLFVFYHQGMIQGSWDSILGIWTTYKLNNKGFESWQGQEIFSSPKPVQLALRSIQLPIQWVLRFFPRDKAAGA
jgi:hypothetical protein